MDRQATIDLRPWSEGDFPLLERLLGDPLMTKYLGGPESPEKLRQRHQRYLDGGDSGRDTILVIVVGPDRIPAGTVGYWEREWQERVVWETGWSVLPDFQGQGIATRAMELAIDRVRQIGAHQFMHAFPSIENAPSNAICRKLGFSLLGEFEFEYPLGNFMHCNDWRLDLLGTSAEGGV